MASRSKVWTTEAVQASQRFDYWVGAICECFLEMDADSIQRRDFSARLESVEIADLHFNRVTGSAQDVYRTRRAISRSDSNYYYLLCKEDTPCNVIQCDKGEARLLAGDLVLIDSRQRYELHFPTSVDILAVQLPIPWLDSWLPDAQGLLARRIDGGSGWGMVLSAYLRQMASAHSLLSPALHRDHLGGIIAAAFGETQSTDAEFGADAALFARIETVLGSRFSEPGLSAARVAACVGISVRTLYRALSRRSMTFATLLDQYRIAAAGRMLSSSACKHLTIAEIGRRAGWSDASHFTRAWKAKTGERPSETRHKGQ